MLGTDLLDGYMWSFTKGTKQVFSEMLEDYNTLYNVVDKRQNRVIKWLKSLGCAFYDVDEVVAGYPLLGFYLRNDLCFQK